MREDEETRRCSGCNKRKILSGYYKKNNGTYGQCKFCELVKSRARYRAKKILRSQNG